MMLKPVKLAMNILKRTLLEDVIVKSNIENREKFVLNVEKFVTTAMKLLVHSVEELIESQTQIILLIVSVMKRRDILKTTLQPVFVKLELMMMGQSVGHAQMDVKPVLQRLTV